MKQGYTLYFLTEKAENLELNKVNYLTEKEKSIIEVLRDKALNVNELNNQLANNKVFMHNVTLKSILISLNEEGWVKIR